MSVARKNGTAAAVGNLLQVGAGGAGRDASTVGDFLEVWDRLPEGTGPLTNGAWVDPVTLARETRDAVRCRLVRVEREATPAGSAPCPVRALYALADEAVGLVHRVGRLIRLVAASGAGGGVAGEWPAKLAVEILPRLVELTETAALLRARRAELDTDVRMNRVRDVASINGRVPPDGAVALWDAIDARAGQRLAVDAAIGAAVGLAVLVEATGLVRDRAGLSPSPEGDGLAAPTDTQVAALAGSLVGGVFYGGIPARVLTGLLEVVGEAEMLQWLDAERRIAERACPPERAWMSRREAVDEALGRMKGRAFLRMERSAADYTRDGVEGLLFDSLKRGIGMVVASRPSRRPPETMPTLTPEHLLCAQTADRHAADIALDADLRAVVGRPRQDRDRLSRAWVMERWAPWAVEMYTTPKR